MNLNRIFESVLREWTEDPEIQKQNQRYGKSRVRCQICKKLALEKDGEWVGEDPKEPGYDGDIYFTCNRCLKLMYDGQLEGFDCKRN